MFTFIQTKFNNLRSELDKLRASRGDEVPKKKPDASNKPPETPTAAHEPDANLEANVSGCALFCPVYIFDKL